MPDHTLAHRAQNQPFRFDFRIDPNAPSFLDLNTPVTPTTNLQGVPATPDGFFGPQLQNLGGTDPLAGLDFDFNRQPEIGSGVITDPSKNFFNTNVIPGLEALSGLTQAYTGLKQLDLSRDAFNFNRNLANTNLANQADLTQRRLEDRARFVGQGANLTPAEIQASIDALPQLRRTV